MCFLGLPIHPTLTLFPFWLTSFYSYYYLLRNMKVISITETKR